MLIEGPGKGAPAGTHAFIVGVSHYPYADGQQATKRGEESGIKNLTTAAKSASDVADWLLTEYCNPEAPLAGVRILLSPMSGEELNSNVKAAMGDNEEQAARDAVKREFDAFRADCRSNPQNVAFVYVAGHGVQLDKHGAIVLLHDFAVEGQGFLHGAIDIVGCHEAMNEGGNALHQLWFSDACRETLSVVKNFATLSGAFKPEDSEHGEVKASPLFLAASSRETAFATIGENTIFSRALLSALRGDAAFGPDPRLCANYWHVPTTELEKYLPLEVERLLAGRELQNVVCTGRVHPMVAQTFLEIPRVDIIVDLDPEDARTDSQAALLTSDGEPCQPVDSSWPLEYHEDAGIYGLNITVRPPPLQKVFTKMFPVTPPSCQMRVQVG